MFTNHYLCHISCSWKGKVCTHEDFNLSITDAGICYTFNAVLTNDSFVRSTGRCNVSLRLLCSPIIHSSGLRVGAMLASFCSALLTNNSFVRSAGRCNVSFRLLCLPMIQFVRSTGCSNVSLCLLCSPMIHLSSLRVGAILTNDSFVRPTGRCNFSFGLLHF